MSQKHDTDKRGRGDAAATNDAESTSKSEAAAPAATSEKPEVQQKVNATDERQTSGRKPMPEAVVPEPNPQPI